MAKLIIGTQGEAINLDVLLESRALIQANSGGGKSVLVRKLAELLYGKVQVIIIDPEGDFYTLREKHDFLLVGKEGEIPADVRSAGLLATKLLELNASAICDIFEMQPRDRHLWVKLFLESMINAPKKLWHPVVVIVDEAHMFAPEKGQGESVATDAMVDLASRGRKRGFCGIFATQRLGKFSKNVTAELQNVLIGSTFLDIDRHRAAETLGIPRQEERQFSADMKVMEPGNFYALGRAISKERIQLKVIYPETTHLKAGAKRKATPPPASSRVMAMLADLKDLPAQAEQKIQTEAELRKEITVLRKELVVARKAQPPQPPPPAPLDPELVVKITSLVQSNVANLFDHVAQASVIAKDLVNLKSALERTHSGAKANAESIAKILNKLSGRTMPRFTTVEEMSPDPTAKKVWSEPVKERIFKPSSVNAGADLPPGEEATLAALIQYPTGLKRPQLRVLTAYKRSSSDSYIARLKEKDYVEIQGDLIVATKSGHAALPDAEPLPTGSALQEYWLDRLPPGERKILEELINVYPHSIARTELDERCGMARSSRDSYISRMFAKELLEDTGRGFIKVSSNLFDL